MVAATLASDGFVVFPHDPAVRRWADAAFDVAHDVLKRPGERRHGGTWFVGVDALPNAPDGSIGNVPLHGAWMDHVPRPCRWHRAQLSVVFPGYPQQDPNETDAAHRYRVNRDAAHVDGLLPEGPARRRHLREPHSFALGLPLDSVTASPLVVWPGSHRIIGAAFTRAFAGLDPAHMADVDVTDTYQSARRDVFAHCARQEIIAVPGQAILLHRHLLHGVSPWGDHTITTARMMAYFRPIGAMKNWLN